MVTQERHWRDIRNALAECNICALLGAGVTLATCSTPSAKPWKALIQSGVNEVCDYGAVKDLLKWRSRQDEALSDGDLIDLLGVAQQVEARLRLVPGAFSRWITNEFECLRADHRSLIGSVGSLNCPIATTNYDNLVETILNRRTVVWTQKLRLSNWLKNRQGPIFHIHGIYDQPDSIILGNDSYSKVVTDPSTQFSLRNLASLVSLLFIGTGDGIYDPNFDQLLTWLKANGDQISQRHFILVEQDRLEYRQAEELQKFGIQPVIYGKLHDDLPDFIKSLSLRLAPPIEEAISLYISAYGIPDWETRVKLKDQSRDKMRAYFSKSHVDRKDLNLSFEPVGVALCAAVWCDPRRDDMEALNCISFRSWDAHGCHQALDAIEKCLNSLSVNDQMRAFAKQCTTNIAASVSTGGVRLRAGEMAMKFKL